MLTKSLTIFAMGVAFGGALGGLFGFGMVNIQDIPCANGICTVFLSNGRTAEIATDEAPIFPPLMGVGCEGANGTLYAIEESDFPICKSIQEVNQ